MPRYKAYLAYAYCCFVCENVTISDFKPYYFDNLDMFSYDQAAVEECRIDSSRLTLSEVIGQGYFGKVYRGELINDRADTRLTVAVKTLLGGCC